MSWVFLIIALVFVVIIKLDMFYNSPQPSLRPDEPFGRVTTREGAEPSVIKIGDASLNIEIADTDAERVRGLSGRESLPQDMGLLFVFDQEERVGIWMKDMNFPIDIAWLNKNKKIIHIEHSVSPDTYPKIFTPPLPALFVLETNTGFFTANNIKITDIVDF